MNVPPSEAKQMTMWEYEALLVEWNTARDPDGDLDVVTGDDVAAMERFLAENPKFLH